MNDTDQVRMLLFRVINGTADSADHKKLSRLLRLNPDLQDEYLNIVDCHATLCWMFRDRSEAEPRAASNNACLPGRRWSWKQPLFAGASVLVLLLLLLHVPWNPQLPVDPPHASAARQAALDSEMTASPDSISPLNRHFRSPLNLAHLVDGAEAVFHPRLRPNKDDFIAGSYHLESGIVRLLFRNGADLVIRGPAKFHIIDKLHLRLLSGSVRAMIPPTAQGFTIETEDVQYEDLGTEFGVTVDEASGDSVMQVFDGSVNVRRARSRELLENLAVGGKNRYQHGQPLPSHLVDLSQLPTPGEVGFARWQASMHQLREDPTLIAFYSFTDEDGSGVLKNQAPHPLVSDGQIHGARWVSGRWPRKQALLMDRDDDFVELEIPGQFQELTVSCWVKPERFDFPLNAIFNSNGWGPGDIHLQIDRGSLIRGGMYGPIRLYDRPRNGIVETGKWTHVMFTASQPNRKQRLFVNGVCVAESPILSRGSDFNDPIRDVIIQPGVCRLGNWEPRPRADNPLRAFRGRIDELAIWNRELNSQEIGDLYRSGRP